MDWLRCLWLIAVMAMTFVRIDCDTVNTTLAAVTVNMNKTSSMPNSTTTTTTTTAATFTVPAPIQSKYANCSGRPVSGATGAVAAATAVNRDVSDKNKECCFVSVFDAR